MAKADVGRRSDVQGMFTGWVGWVVFASVMMIDIGRLANGGKSEPVKAKPK